MSRPLVSLLLLAALLAGQEFRSTISGLVSDPQGASISGARIETKQAQTGAVFQTVSGADGQYTLPFLPPGDYVVTISAPGFKRFSRECKIGRAHV